jgi:hypothetical protein
MVDFPLARLIRDYKSSHSGISHDYLHEMIQQVKRRPERMGFFDGSKWVRSLKWKESSWRGFTGHDWKYAMHMQEGACWYSILSGKADLEREVESEFNFIHTKVSSDGSVYGVPDAFGTDVYEYGLILSCLSLGCLCFGRKNPDLAEQCFRDMNKVYDRVKDTRVPMFPVLASLKNTLGGRRMDDEFHYLLIAFANAWKAFDERDEHAKAEEAGERVVRWAKWFLRKQKSSGMFFPAIQANEKIDHALCLSFDVTDDQTYLDAVEKNLDWIVGNRIEPNGGLTWKPTNVVDFFECHQLWFILACRLLSERNPDSDYAEAMIKVWHFLTDQNWADIDWYVHNETSNGAFFAYRNMDRKGHVQNASFKGSYEIGTAIWSLSANYSF